MVTMRRITHILLAALAVLLLAGPASAQGRDPFEPQPGSGQEEGGDGGSSGGERDPFDPREGDGSAETPDDGDGATDPSTDDPTEPSGTGEVDEQPDVDDEDGEVGGELANTGFDVFTWTGIAYLLIVVGCAALVAGRLFAPVTSRRRR